MKKKKKGKPFKTYPLVAFPFLGTFWDDSIDIGSYDVDRSDNFDSLGMCMRDSFELIAWKRICNLRKKMRKKEKSLKSNT